MRWQPCKWNFSNLTGKRSGKNLWKPLCQEQPFADLAYSRTKASLAQHILVFGLCDEEKLQLLSYSCLVWAFAWFVFIMSAPTGAWPVSVANSRRLLCGVRWSPSSPHVDCLTCDMLRQSLSFCQRFACCLRPCSHRDDANAISDHSGVRCANGMLSGCDCCCWPYLFGQFNECISDVLLRTICLV